MSTQITLTLSDEVYLRAERLAKLSERPVEEILSRTLADSLPSLTPSIDSLQPISELSDAEVLALTEMQMEPEQDQRLSLLLDRQQSGTLLEIERPELQGLMQIYQVGLLRKARALNEAVKRGLRGPLEP